MHSEGNTINRQGSRGKTCPEQDARVKGRGRRRVVDDRRADREKKGKGFDFRGKVRDLSTGRVKAKELKDRIAGHLKVRKNIFAPIAKSKMF